MKHTKGPWECVEDTCGGILIKTKGNGSFRQIAIIPNPPRIGEFDWLNAHLIAAAPDMLENILDLVETLEKYVQPVYSPDSALGLEISTRLDFAKQAIAKAKGEE